MTAEAEPSQQPSQQGPKGRIGAFFSKHGGTVAAVAGLAAAAITLYVVLQSRGSGGSSSTQGSTPVATGASGGTTDVSSQLAAISTQESALATMLANLQATANAIRTNGSITLNGINDILQGGKPGKVIKPPPTPKPIPTPLPHPIEQPIHMPITNPTQGVIVPLVQRIPSAPVVRTGLGKGSIA